MNILLKNILRCPFCSGSFSESDYKIIEDQNGYGLLHCHCSTMPVLEGIPIMGIGLATSRNIYVQHLIDLIEQSRYEQALSLLLVPRPPEYPKLIHPLLKRIPEMRGLRRIKRISYESNVKKWRQQTEAVFLHSNGVTSARNLMDLHFNNSASAWSEAYYYFAYRFGQPRHLVALAFAALIENPKGPILDVGCGFGHISFNLLRRAGKQPVLGIDNDFFALYVAKKYIAPGAHYICCDVNYGLPIQDNIFSTVIYADVFHYIKNKDVIIYESKRVTLPDGNILVSSSRNRLIPNHYAGYALPPGGYIDLLKNYNYCILSNDNVLDRYLEKLKPDISSSAPLDELKSKTLFSFVISENNDIFKDHGKLGSWPHGEGILTLNPFFNISRNTDSDLVYLKKIFPSSFYEEDHPEYKRYLPESIMIPSSLLSDLPHVDNNSLLEELLRRCVLIGVPSYY
jgi:ubiquinone/menaquinone biosynthesis C-methylase UbiE